MVCFRKSSKKNVLERLGFVLEFRINIKWMLFRIFYVVVLPKKTQRIY